MAVKFVFPNLLQTPGAVIVPDSELTSMPRANLLKTSASSRLRFAGPWVIRTGENDKIDFDRGGLFNATVASGTYTTPTAMAAAAQAAMVAADGGAIWSVAYTANKFVFSANVAFELLFGSVNTFFDQSIHLDLGFASADTVSATSHTAGNVSYQSRHVIYLDLGSAQAFTTGVVHGHNFLTAGTVTMQADSATLVGVGLSDTGNPDFTQVLAGTDTRAAAFASQSKRYLRLIINDVSNPDGYTELGVWWPGTYGQPTVLPSVQYSKDNEHLSDLHFADGGAHHKVPRTRRRVYKLLFQLEERNGLAVADRALFDAIDALGIGTNFFMTLDVVNDPPITVYGYNRVGLHEVYDRGTLWAIVMEFAEALG